MIKLNPDVNDALNEIFNIGIGQAASVLSTLVDDEILLTIPELMVLQHSEFADYAKAVWGDKASIVHQNFDGPFHGDALLIFPVQQSLDLVRALLATNEPIETMTELERETLLEIGNIILNACLSSVADMLEREITNSLPRYIESTPSNIISQIIVDPQCCVLFLRIQFTVERHDVHGHIIIVLDIPAIDSFQYAAIRLLRIHDTQWICKEDQKGISL
ncbi:chemotaxis protein CheC [Azospirillaceae bacterium]